jgi:outer membrane protein OmpA-like peptidoglycan-associated protein
MKKIVFILFLFLTKSSYSQTIIDTCFSSIELFSDYEKLEHNNNGYYLDPDDSKAITGLKFHIGVFDGNKWLLDQTGKVMDYMNPPSIPKELKGARLIALPDCGGTESTRKPLSQDDPRYFNVGYIAFRLNKSLIEGELVSIPIVYFGTVDKDIFTPIIYTGKTAKLNKNSLKKTFAGKYKACKLKTARNSLTYDTILFITNSKQAGHEWIIIRATEMGGILSFCSGRLLKKLQDDLLKIDPVLVHTAYEKNKIITLDNIFFLSDQSELLNKSFSELDKLADDLKENNNTTIEIFGYTDNIGTEENNHKLSEDRANAVAAYLISKGISRSRVTYKGLGSSKPIASNETEEGRQQNRRVEFVIKQQ